MTGSLRQFSRLVAAVFEHQLITLRRYIVNTLSLLVTIYVIFAILFFGGRYVGGPAIADSMEGIVVGYFLFTAVLSAYFGTADNIQNEAQWGTLEQLYMSPHGFGRIIAVKSVWNVLWGVGVGVVILASILLTTDQSLGLNLVTTLTITVLSILSVLGIGFVFAGLSLIYKRIENVTSLMQFVFIGLIAAPAIRSDEFLVVLPLVQGSDMLNEAMTKGTHITEFPPSEVAILLANGVLYLLLGYAVLRFCIDRARRLGVLGHY